MRQPPVRRMDDTVFAFEMGACWDGEVSLPITTVSIKFNKIYTEEALEIWEMVVDKRGRVAMTRYLDRNMGTRRKYAKDSSLSSISWKSL